MICLNTNTIINQSETKIAIWSLVFCRSFSLSLCFFFLLFSYFKILLPCFYKKLFLIYKFLYNPTNTIICLWAIGLNPSHDGVSPALGDICKNNYTSSDIPQFSNLTSNMENSVFKIWFKMKSVAIEGKCFFCSQNHFREHWHTINSSLFINIFLMCWKKIWRIIDIKESSCNIIYEINLSGMSILFSNKDTGFQRLPIGLSSIIYWAKKIRISGSQN